MRVIAGSAKGRPLTAPPGHHTRPTTDLVREAIFSALEAEAMRRGSEPGAPLPFGRVLDLYAGTGALGIEALSRGAEHADFVETNPRARAAIQLNLQRTGFVKQGSVHGFRAEAATEKLGPGYHLILADPPYTDPATASLIAIIGGSNLLNEDGIFVLEYSRGFEPPTEAGALHLDHIRRYGTTYVAYYLTNPTAGAA